jgi:toxin-antitoxin system PIN domain toxin
VTSCDTNILFAACDADSPHHAAARTFLASHAGDSEFCLCEQVLLELYCLLRNPAVSRPPLSALQAVSCIRQLRANPHWRIVDVVPGQGGMDDVWRLAEQDAMPFRRVFDLRLAFTLLGHGVTDFATRNARDFRDVGFARLWDPTAPRG